jgi:hypothetical protein
VLPLSQGSSYRSCSPCQSVSPGTWTTWQVLQWMTWQDEYSVWMTWQAAPRNRLRYEYSYAVADVASAFSRTRRMTWQVLAVDDVAGRVHNG